MVRFTLEAIWGGVLIVASQEKKLKSFRWLKGITLGPLNKDSRYKDGLELYLKSKGLNVEIIESCAPYRT